MRNDSQRRRYIPRPDEQPTPLWGEWGKEVIVDAAVEDALAEQWHTVYDPDSLEKNLERGGLVLR